MEINFTIIGQLITFAVLVFFTMKYVWPPITQAMHEREKKIADGLAAAEKGQRDLELAEHKSVEIIQAAKIEAAHIVEQANKRAQRIIEEEKENARKEGERLIHSAQDEIEQMINQAKRDLQNQTAELAISMAQKIMQRDIDANTQRKLLDQIAAEI